jgi:hypothetical protein
MLERLIRNLQAAAAVLMTDDARAARRLRRKGKNKVFAVSKRGRRSISRAS